MRSDLFGASGDPARAGGASTLSDRICLGSHVQRVPRTDPQSRFIRRNGQIQRFEPDGNTLLRFRQVEPDKLARRADTKAGLTKRHKGDPVANHRIINHNWFRLNLYGCKYSRLRSGACLNLETDSFLSSAPATTDVHNPLVTIGNDVER